MTEILEQNTIKKNTIERMKSLGIYDSELHDEILEKYSQLKHENQKAVKESVNAPLIVETERGAQKRNPIFVIRDTQEKLLRMYERQLGIAPNQLKKTKAIGKENKPETKLEKVMRELGQPIRSRE